MALKGQTKLTKISSPSYTNILYSDSDSDNIPDLKLPPLKGKKPKRRKGSNGKHDDSFCNLWTMLKLITAVVIFLVLTILAATCFWTFIQIRQLQQHIAAYDNSDKVAAEMMKLQSHLAEVNATVKAGLGSLQQITTSLTDAWKKLEELGNENRKVQEHSSASNELLSGKEQKLLQDLAIMGSDIIQMKNTSLQKNGDFENRLAKLEEMMTSDPQSLRQILDQQSARVKILEDITKSYSNDTKPGQDSVWVTELVTRLIQEKALPTSSSLVENGKFLAFRADILGNFEQINDTLDTLSQELDAVSSRLDSHDKTLVDLAVVISSIKSIGVRHSPEHTKVAGSVSPTSNSTESTSGDTSSSNSSLQEKSMTEVNKSTAVIHIDGINTWQDLHEAYQNKWPLDNDQLDVNALNQLGPFVLDTDQLKQFDLDGNGLYTEGEMAAALGFHHDPNPRFSNLDCVEMTYTQNKHLRDKMPETSHQPFETVKNDTSHNMHRETEVQVSLECNIINYRPWGYTN